MPRLYYEFRTRSRRHHQRLFMRSVATPFPEKGQNAPNLASQSPDTGGCSC